MEDGREISFPLTSFPRLVDATINQLNNWRFIGQGIDWPELDEDVLVEWLLD